MSKIIVDVREPFEYNRGHVPGALNLPPAKLLRGMPSELADVAKDTEIVLYCLSGARSGASMRILRQFGFTNVVNGINKDHVTAKFL